MKVTFTQCSDDTRDFRAHYREPETGTQYPDDAPRYSGAMLIALHQAGVVQAQRIPGESQQVWEFDNKDIPDHFNCNLTFPIRAEILGDVVLSECEKLWQSQVVDSIRGNIGRNWGDDAADHLFNGYHLSDVLDASYNVGSFTAELSGYGMERLLSFVSSNYDTTNKHPS